MLALPIYFKPHTAIYWFMVLVTGMSGCSPASKQVDGPDPVFQIEFSDDINCIQFSPDSNLCLIVAATQIRLIDRQSGKIEGQSRQLPFSYDKLYEFANFSYDGSELVVCGNAAGIQIVDPRTFEVVNELGEFQQNPVFAYATDNSQDFVTLADGNMLRRINFDTAAVRWETKTDFETVFSVHSHRGEWIALAEYGDRVCLYNMATGAKSHLVIEHADTVRGIAFSDDNRLIATTGKNGILKIHVLETAELEWEVEAERRGAFAVAFHPDGDLVAVGCMGGIQIWSMRQRRLVIDWRAHTWFVNSIQFSNDGKQLLSGSADKTVKMWALADLGL